MLCIEKYVWNACLDTPGIKTYGCAALIGDFFHEQSLNMVPILDKNTIKNEFVFFKIFEIFGYLHGKHPQTPENCEKCALIRENPP